MLLMLSHWETVLLVQPVQLLVAMVLGDPSLIGDVKIVVTQACSGRTFFALLLGMGLLHCKRVWQFPTWLATALLFTYAVNTVRVIAACAAEIGVKGIIPDRFLNAVHMTTGALIFLFGLYVGTWLVVMVIGVQSREA